MKKILGIIVLSLLLSVTSKADDISNFEIEEMSIGDTLLQFYNKDEIINYRYTNSYKDDKFLSISIESENFKTYEVVDIEYLKEDKNLLIKAISGTIYQSDIEDCYKKMETIGDELSSLFSSAKVSSGEHAHMADPSGKSTVRDITFDLANGSILVQCYDYNSSEIGSDNLTLSIWSKTFVEYLETNPYN